VIAEDRKDRHVDGREAADEAPAGIALTRDAAWIEVVAREDDRIERLLRVHAADALADGIRAFSGVARDGDSQHPVPWVEDRRSCLFGPAVARQQGQNQ
jgi:hypothetical protein